MVGLGQCRFCWLGVASERVAVASYLCGFGILGVCFWMLWCLCLLWFGLRFRSLKGGLDLSLLVWVCAFLGGGLGGCGVLCLIWVCWFVCEWMVVACLFILVVACAKTCFSWLVACEGLAGLFAIVGLWIV